MQESVDSKSRGAAAIAQWIPLRLSFSCRGFEGSSPKHTVYDFIIYSQICAIFVCENIESKQKSGRVRSIKKVGTNMLSKLPRTS